MPPFLPIGSRSPPSAAIAAEITALSDADLLRLRAIGRMRARGLAGLDALDLLNEAILRVLAGSRARPPHVPLVVLLATTMRSVAHDHWRRARREGALLVPADPEALDRADPAPEVDPERVIAAAQALAEIDRLFAGDAVALQIVAGLSAGLDAVEIRRRFGLDPRTYDSARKRMRRALLRRDGDGGRP